MRQSRELLQLTGLRKAGVLMVALGAEVSGEILKHLTQEEVERISSEIARLKQVEPEAIQAVVDEFQERLNAEEFVEQGGIEFARQLLDHAVGTEKSREIVGHLGHRSSARPFESIRSVDPSQLFQFIQGEHPQTIALILSYLPAASAGAVLSGLPPEIQSDVATRVATMDATSPEIVAQVEQVIGDLMSTMGTQDVTSVGGSKSLIEILNQVDRATERTILEGLSAVSPSLADAIKEQMFIFEDIINLDNRTVQLILREVDQEDLRLALKGVGDNVRELIFRNISERAAETLKEDIELMGPVRVRDVEAAQQKIVAVIRRLEEAGEVVTRRSGEDEIIE